VAEARDAGEDFRSFFDREYARLARALFLVTSSGSEAEDLAQEAMVRLFERWDRVAGMASPTGYLYRTAMNLHRSRLRKLRRFPRPSSSRGADGPEPSSVVEVRDQIARALDRVPIGQRRALVLVEWLGLDAEEAGRVLGIKAVSVRVRVSRARKALKDLLEEDR
jgi:RNA polymerase sigma-70 factor (ECF subfamily)